jgi:hypothetical protein
VIDRSRCMAALDPITLGGPRCQEPATHDSIVGRRCAAHAEELRQALRSPNTFINVLSGVRTEEEIARLVVPLPS